MLITLKDEMVKGAGCSERVEKKRKEKPFTIWACSLNQSQIVLFYFLA